jgi:HSF-type DNA-binding
MDILSNECDSNIISWLPHGKGFMILKKKKFASEILPKYFKQSKFTSFTRKLNRWGFTRVTRGPETGAYYHKCFQKDDPSLCLQMSCQTNNVTKNQQQQQQQHLFQFPRTSLSTLPSTSDLFNGNQQDMFHQMNPLLNAATATDHLASSMTNANRATGVMNGGRWDLMESQNPNWMHQQLQQLQMQQLQLQQLHMQQLQAAEMFRQQQTVLAKQHSQPLVGLPSLASQLQQLTSPLQSTTPMMRNNSHAMDKMNTMQMMMMIRAAASSSSNMNDDKLNNANALLLQSLQQQQQLQQQQNLDFHKESGFITGPTTPLFLSPPSGNIPSDMSSVLQNVSGDASRPAAGNGRAWAA